ncbi:MAG TPA: NAD(P)-binding domain-containing protein, partial [Nannocystaceae bacterium]|nr:NAD(P)-binding domain-containing protein [Nannocystaceae bacterium]
MTRVAVLGGGGFGRSLASQVARVGKRVMLWSREHRDIGEAGVEATTRFADVAEAELVFVAVPSLHVATLAREVGHYLDGAHFMVHVSRGLLGPELGTITQLVRELTPVRRVGVLAGPLVARALASGEPGGGIVGSLFPEVGDAVRDAIGGPTLRIYSTQDVVGVEVASAMVGLLALAIGWAQGRGFGPSTTAILATRGMAEAARIGVACGAEERTFSGLAGFGDLTAAVAGDERPETLFGRALAEGLPLAQAAERAGAFVEGTSIAENATAFAQRHGFEAPICTAMAALLSGRASPNDVLMQLMTR